MVTAELCHTMAIDLPSSSAASSGSWLLPVALWMTDEEAVSEEVCSGRGIDCISCFASSGAVFGSLVRVDDSFLETDTWEDDVEGKCLAGLLVSRVGCGAERCAVLHPGRAIDSARGKVRGIILRMDWTPLLSS